MAGEGLGWARRRKRKKKRGWWKAERGREGGYIGVDWVGMGVGVRWVFKFTF